MRGEKINIDCWADEKIAEGINGYRFRIGELESDLARCREDGRRMAATIGELRRELDELHARHRPKEDQ